MERGVCRHHPIALQRGYMRLLSSPTARLPITMLGLFLTLLAAVSVGLPIFAAHPGPTLHHPLPPLPLGAVPGPRLGSQRRAPRPPPMWGGHGRPPPPTPQRVHGPGVGACRAPLRRARRQRPPALGLPRWSEPGRRCRGGRQHIAMGLDERLPRGAGWAGRTSELLAQRRPGVHPHPGVGRDVQPPYGARQYVVVRVSTPGSHAATLYESM